MEQYKQQVFPGLEMVGEPTKKTVEPTEEPIQPSIPDGQCSILKYKEWTDDDLEQLQQIKEALIVRNLKKMRRLLSSSKIRNIYFLNHQLEDDIQYLALNEIIARKYNGLSRMDEVKEELKEAVEIQVDSWYKWDKKSHEEKLALIEMTYEKNEKSFQKFLQSDKSRDFVNCYRSLTYEGQVWEFIEMELQLRYGPYRRPRSLQDIKPKANWFGDRRHSTLDPKDIYQTIQKKQTPVKTKKK